MLNSNETPIIQIKGLNKTFSSDSNTVVALNYITIDIMRGEIFGVIGLSGAGKSTLVRCINLLERPTAGQVIVDGQEMTLLSEKQLRRARQNIGMIFQGFNLLMQRTALDNICFPLELAGVPRKEAIKRAEKLLDTVGLSDKAKAYPSQLSGGQKQRIAIARALANNPKVLLCDEATSALDPTTTQSILALLKQLNQQLGVTVVIITHEMKVIEQVCSRVAIIAESRIVEMGMVEEVFRHPKTAAAKKLIYPMGQQVETFTGKGNFIRLVFNGDITARPIVADMVLTCGAPVSIAFADTKEIDGMTYGQMILQMPENPVTYQRMLNYLDDEGITYTEEGESYVQ